MKRTLLAMLTATTCALAMAAPMRASAADAGLDCSLRYNLTGWSLIYKHTTGEGTVRCANGQTMHVHVSAKAVGITAGKWHIDDGKGSFTDVHRISDVLGSYAQASANAGVVKSAEAQVLTKGPVSLALSGGGEGVNLGVDVGEFTIKAR
ncbi:MAG TPA: hypothetical protein VGT79_11265 [Xanthomonadaceae bacterium]|nr:hypothetical protein [Xanthomonadaceae bacterium]